MPRCCPFDACSLRISRSSHPLNSRYRPHLHLLKPCLFQLWHWWTCSATLEWPPCSPGKVTLTLMASPVSIMLTSHRCKDPFITWYNTFVHSLFSLTTVKFMISPTWQVSRCWAVKYSCWFVVLLNHFWWGGWNVLERTNQTCHRSNLKCVIWVDERKLSRDFSKWALQKGAHIQTNFMFTSQKENIIININEHLYTQCRYPMGKNKNNICWKIFVYSSVDTLISNKDFNAFSSYNGIIYLLFESMYQSMLVCDFFHIIWWKERRYIMAFIASGFSEFGKYTLNEEQLIPKNFLKVWEEVYFSEYT